MTERRHQEVMAELCRNTGLPERPEAPAPPAPAVAEALSADQPLWSCYVTLSALANLYNVDRRTMKAMLDKGAPRGKKLSRQTWIIDLNTVPPSVRPRLS